MGYLKPARFNISHIYDQQSGRTDEEQDAFQKPFQTSSELHDAIVLIMTPHSSAILSFLPSR